MAQPVLLDEPKSDRDAPQPSGPWWRQMNGYHWFVLLVASAAWFFDCLDQRLFSLARNPALGSLMHLPAKNTAVQDFGKIATAFFLIGWGTGGMIFGALGDKFGRARMLSVTILIYSAFTGLTFFSHSKFDFTLFRFLTGVGVGGVFGLAVAMIAETVPTGARAASLGLLQVLSTIGNIAAGLIKMGIDSLEGSKVLTPGEGWRWMFLIGAVPALMVIVIGRYLREPEPWLRLKESGQLPKGGLFAPYRGLIRDKQWRHNLIVGALIASTGVVGLWAIGEYAWDIQTAVFDKHFSSMGLSPDQVKAKAEHAKTIAYLLNMLGAGTGMWLFTRLAMSAGRKTAFYCGFIAAMIVTFFVYWQMKTPQQAYWMMFLMGMAQLSVFAGFAIYLPELFPSRMRSTGTSFCYNLGRFAAAVGSFFSAELAQGVYGKFPSPLPSRYSAMTMCALFLVGLFTLPFAPETKGKPLPEDE